MDDSRREKLLKALANKRRLALLKRLQQTDERTVTELAESIRLSFRATSQHLRILDSVGLVTKRKEDLYVFYRIADENKKLVRYMLQL